MISPPVLRNRGLYGTASRDALKLKAHEVTTQNNSIGSLRGVKREIDLGSPKFYEIKEDV